MQPSEQWMAANFHHLNDICFNGQLPTPQFLVVTSTKFNGQCGAKNWRAEHPNFFIKLNQNPRTEWRLKNTLLHEMIHLYFQSQGMWDVRHGEQFQRMVMTMNRRGWDVSFH